MTKSITQIALKDISKEVRILREEDSLSRDIFKLNPYSNFDSWVVGVSHIQTKETTRLNRVLGIHKLNKSNKVKE